MAFNEQAWPQAVQAHGVADNQAQLEVNVRGGSNGRKKAPICDDLGLFEDNST